MANGIACIDNKLSQLMSLIALGENLANCFFNPHAILLNDIKNIGYGLLNQIDILLLGPLPNPCLTTLRLNLVHLTGESTGVGFADSPMGHMLSYTNFLTGQAPSFPGNLAPYLTGISGASVVGGLTFTGLLGIAKSGSMIDTILCPDNNPNDPNNPCSGMNRIFDAIFSPFGVTLNGIKSGLAAMTDLEGQACAYVDLVAGFIANLVNKLISAISELARQLLQALRYGFAKLLHSIFQDPCLVSIIETAGTTALNNALAYSIS